jgi:hypothetical protein
MLFSRVRTLARWIGFSEDDARCIAEGTNSGDAAALVANALRSRRGGRFPLASGLGNRRAQLTIGPRRRVGRV